MSKKGTRERGHRDMGTRGKGGYFSGVVFLHFPLSPRLLLCAIATLAELVCSESSYVCTKDETFDQNQMLR